MAEQKRVLVVDDEEDLTWSIAKHLSKDKNKYELITVNSGKAALEVLSQLPVELVISDVRMPEISGLDLLLRIRENYPTTKVIIMTAYGSSEVQQEASERGCFKYIEKPFEIQELRQLILDSVEEKKGFEGRISDFQLSDLIQMNCLGRLTNALHIKKDLQSGVIYFEDGNIIHAVLDNLQGEEAFYEILSWEGGSFSVEKGVTADKETIVKGWQSLLLEGLRRADEQQNVIAQKRQSEKSKRQRRLSDIMDEMLDIKGVKAVILFDGEGFPIASKVRPQDKNSFNIPELVNEFAGLQNQTARFSGEIKLGKPVEIFIDFENGMMHLIQITQREEYAVLITDKTSSLGLLRMESKKYLKRLAEEL